ncbi:uncharacterized protein [Pseudorca crassidens]|uniref:uncharacterized protein isoform X4 n=1 Tax=Pseudorca crassidens TaxID=82174 RepID=UPI00352E4ED7
MATVTLWRARCILAASLDNPHANSLKNKGRGARDPRGRRIRREESARRRRRRRREGGERKTGVPAAAAAAAVAVRGEGEPCAARAPGATTRPGRWTLGYPQAGCHLLGEGPHLCLFLALEERCRNRSSENGGLCRKEECDCVSGTAQGSRSRALPGTSGHSPSSTLKRGHSHSRSTPSFSDR